MRKFTKNVLLLLAILLSFGSIAQTRITGTVSSSDGETLPGVTVRVKNGTAATVTNVEGQYEISAPRDATLIFSFLGMKTQEIALNGRNILHVILENDENTLEEVVVSIGYGSVRKKDLTGAVSSIGSDKLSAIPVASPMEAIAGRLAGVQISTTEGSPDAEMRIRVRGGGSITGDNTPLFIVDGFPVSSISDIAPTDIESIDVLKDASSTAIYGARGANGVIIITTKSGKAGKMSVSFNSYGGFKNLANKLNVLTPYDYALWQYERALLANSLTDYTNYFGNFQDIDLYKEVTPNDWQDITFGRTGYMFNNNVNVNGGSEKTKYTLSYTNIQDKAIMQLSAFQRDNLTFRLNNKPYKNVALDLSVRYSDTRIEGGGTNEQNAYSSADSRLKFAMIYPPFPVAGLTSSDDTDEGFNLFSPIRSLQDNDRYQRRKNYTFNGSVSWNILSDLMLKVEGGLDDYRAMDNRFYGTSTYYVNNVPSAENQGLPAISFEKQGRQSLRNTNTLNYDFNKIMAQGHKLNLLVGEEFIHTTRDIFTSIVHGFPKTFNFDDATKLSSQGSANSVENYLYPDEKLLSFFGRANYDYKGRYLLSATFRADGSSKFSEGNRWGYFPSVAAAWRISDEDFMNSTWINDLKLRASYGTAGNNNIPAGQMAQTFNVSTTTWVNGFNSFWAASKTMANPDLKWETTITRNVGIDFATWKDRLTGTIDAYVNSTKDLLILFPTPGTGYDNQYRNMGETRNRGIEFTLNALAVKSKKFELNVGANISFNRNKIISLGQMENFYGESGWASTEIGADYWIATGGSVGEMYGYISDGRYELSDFSGYNASTGRWILKDGVPDASSVIGTIRPGSMKLKNLTEGDNVVNVSDRTVIGNANPKHTGGFNLSARYGDFDLAAIFNWSYGNDIYNANKVEYTSTSKYHSRNMIDLMASGNRWTNLTPDGRISNDPAELEAMNKNTTLWSPYMSRYVFSDWAVEDGSFLRLNTATVGYTLPQALTSKAKIQKLRFYATGYNLWLLTKYSGFDPEVSTRRRTQLTPGVDYSAYPKSKMFVFGLNLNF
ncbi:SusC/RagA family TonB-linked outer membrane protein [Leadbetterella byssophila]|nr:TonB-dependent receptor [Leadbetterella byssophila]